MKINQTPSRRGFTLVELLVVIVIIAALAGLAAPQIIRQRKKADQTEAVSNARQIGLALFEFETEYGTFPDALTAPVVAQNTGTTAESKTDANARFRQLVLSGLAKSEAIFYSKTAYTKKPDGIMSPDTTAAKACGAGEVGFGMVVSGASGGAGLSAVGNPSRPIAATPFTSALSATGLFDPDFYDNKAVVLKLDNSVVSLNILGTGANKGKVLIAGTPMLDIGTDSVWGNTGPAPTFAMPLAKGAAAP